MNLLQRMQAYRPEASWAVWELDENGALTGNPTFPSNQAPGVIHGRAMIVSLNPATSIEIAESDPKDGWSNFHAMNGKHNDLFLAQALMGTSLWGAYMTDLHPAIVDPKSGNVRPKREQVRIAVLSLIEQAKLLGDVELIVGVGAKSYGSIKRHAALIHSELGEVEIIKIPHYSRANGGLHKHDVKLYSSQIAGALGGSAS